ncbi:MAG: hypothetical protein EP329_24130 [Deltaproteobacteria bacterium]|nr:MAG: hypothetical protein EP329_24130 [Deltaproteobacteria bacterium]
MTHPILGTPTDMWLSRTQYLKKLVSSCLEVTSWGRYTAEESTLNEVRLRAPDHTVDARRSPQQEGRFFISIVRPRR